MPLLLSLLLAASPIQASDTVGVLGTVAQARSALVDLPILWGIDGAAIEWLFVTRDSAWATERRSGVERLVPVTLPADAPRANNSYDLDGRRVAMVVLPLGGDSLSRARLLVHEAMHTFQPDQLPNPGGTEPMDGGDYLDAATGRSWLFLELRALGRAITAGGDARRVAARDALLFRARRDSLALPAERARLDALDLAEGIPEYSAWRLTASDAALLAALLDSSAQRNVSWVRAVAYWTGPAYGYLLDGLSGADWRKAYSQGNRLPAILAAVLGSTPFTERIDARARLYGGEGIRRTELTRDLARTHRLDSLRTRFVTGPVLRLIPGALQVSFDPNGQTPLAGEGTVMMNFRWAGADSAELRAPAGALVSPTWSWIQVPLPRGETFTDGALTASRVIAGEGWTLTLPAGWQLTRIENRLEVRPPAP